MAEDAKPRLVGLNHIALEVGDVEAALAFYRRIFSFDLRGRGKGQAFIDMGDQFVALMETPSGHVDNHRHFGLVVDDRSRVRELAAAAGATLLDGDFLDFLDPWGNRVEVIEYRDVQFTKAPAVLKGMGLAALNKSDDARKQLAEKNLAEKNLAEKNLADKDLIDKKPD